MLIGRLGNTSSAPYLEARVVFPRLKVAIRTPSPGEADVSFLADTGADRTTIMPADLSRFLIAENQLIGGTPVTGVSGEGMAFIEQALVTFLEPGFALRVYVIDIMIMKPTPQIQGVPSLLGRDIMSKWSITIDTPAKRFTAKVVKADHTYKITKNLPGMTALSGIPPPIWRD